jgi:hypothetical protein
VGRDLLAWLFHSPRRLLLVLAALLIVATLAPALVSRLINSGDGSRGSVVEQAAEGTAPTGTANALPEASVVATAPPKALAVVDTFMQIWLSGPSVTTGAGTQEWHRRLVPYVTPELAAALEDAAPDRVPDATVAGSPRVLRVGEFLSHIAMPMSDGKDVTLTVAWDGEVWRVSDIDREAGT